MIITKETRQEALDAAKAMIRSAAMQDKPIHKARIDAYATDETIENLIHAEANYWGVEIIKE